MTDEPQPRLITYWGATAQYDIWSAVKPTNQTNHHKHAPADSYVHLHNRPNPPHATPRTRVPHRSRSNAGPAPPPRTSVEAPTSGEEAGAEGGGGEAGDEGCKQHKYNKWIFFCFWLTGWLAGCFWQYTYLNVHPAGEIEGCWRWVGWVYGFWWGEVCLPLSLSFFFFLCFFVCLWSIFYVYSADDVAGWLSM